MSFKDTGFPVLEIVKNRAWSQVITVYNEVISNGKVTETLFDYTGYTAKLWVKEKPDSPTAKLELSTDDYTLTLGGTGGTITILVPKATIDAANLKIGKHYYDIVITKDGIDYPHGRSELNTIQNVTEV